MNLEEGDLPLDYREAKSRLEDARRAIQEAPKFGAPVEQEAWVRMLCMHQWFKVCEAADRPSSRSLRKTGKANDRDAGGNLELLRDVRKAFAALVSSLTANRSEGKATLKALAAQLSVAGLGTESDRLVLVEPEKSETHIVASSKATLHSALIPCEIIEIDDHKIVVLYEFDGEEEEREFYWSTMTVPRESLKVGDWVLANASLTFLTRPSDAKAPEELDAIWAAGAERARKKAGPGPTHITREAQQAADRVREQGQR